MRAGSGAVPGAGTRGECREVVPVEVGPARSSGGLVAASGSPSEALGSSIGRHEVS